MLNKRRKIEKCSQIRPIRIKSFYSVFLSCFLTVIDNKSFIVPLVFSGRLW